MCGLILAVVSCLPSQPADDWARSLKVAIPANVETDPVLHWNEVVLQAIRAEKTPPPVAARALAIVHTAIYDALNAIDGKHAPYRLAARVPDAAPEVAAAVAAHRALVELFPARTTTFDAELKRSLAPVPEGTAKMLGNWLGRQAAERILQARAGDGSSTRQDYTVAIGPGFWQPTPPDYRPALLPQWRSLSCFCLPSATSLRPPSPPPLKSPAYAWSFKEVKSLGSLDSDVRTPEQTEIALFWADDVGTVTPPGHWNRIAQAVALSRHTTSIDNARLFALLNLALADAAVVCWDCKYHYSLWRPIHAIRSAARDGGEAGGDPNWRPLLNTPPFPSYTSGHSTFSGAGAAVLAGFFGSDQIGFTVASEGGMHGMTRSFTGFSAAAREAGRSRIYGGIHWDFDNVAGLALGKSVGDYVARNFLTPIKLFESVASSQ
jgi:membrane-associated phospholipid phosphatase